jgi:hypothetical protein
MVEQPYARRVQRHTVELPCSIIGPNWDEPVTFAVSDLSARGMWVRTTFPFRRGEHVVVEFRPPRSKRGPRALRAPLLMPFAKVTRAERPKVEGGKVVRRGGMGLEFCDLSRDERRALQRCLRATPTLRDQRDDERPRDSGHGWQTIRGRW